MSNKIKMAHNIYIFFISVKKESNVWTNLPSPFFIQYVTFQEKIKQEFGIECYMPANGETATIKTPITIAASVSANLLRDEARRFDTRY